MIDTPLMNEINEAAAQGKTSLHEEDRLRYEMAEALSYALKITEGIDYTLNTYRIAYRVLTALNQKGYTIVSTSETSSAAPMSEVELKKRMEDAIYDCEPYYNKVKAAIELAKKYRGQP